MHSSRAGVRLAIAASVLSFLIGLFFIFVRAPHPWGWEGIDHYRDLALALARGEPYPSLERLWGYPYFLAAFYRLFGDRQWIPLVVQALLNATIPLLIFVEVRRRIDARTAALAAWLAGALSFNTIYASTPAADGVCTVLFVAALVCFGSASAARSLRLFATSGLLAGLSLMFRPNLLLFPAVLAVVDLALRRRSGWRPAQPAAFLLAAMVVWLSWPIRNYALTDRFIPATTHGGIQLWYGSLQAGEYFERWFDNPRAQLEASPFDYSLPGHRPLEVTARPGKPMVEPSQVRVTYWTNRQSSRTTVTMERTSGTVFRAALHPLPADTVLYYYFDATWKGPGGRDVQQSTPLAGAADPLRHVVSDRHFADLDLNGDTLDVFDIGRLVAAVSGQQPLPASLPLDLDRDGRITARDLEAAAGVLVAPAGGAPPAQGTVRAIEHHPDRTRLVLQDGSSLMMPKAPLVRTVDLDVDGSEASMAPNLIRSARSFASLQQASTPVLPAIGVDFVLRAEVNRSFSRLEPLWMDRYTQLAAANIERSWAAFVAASLRRVLRMFFVLGSDDRFRSAQFAGSRQVYAAATVLSSTYAVLLVAGIAIAWRRNYPMALWLVAVLYVPATIFMMLPNMRYVVTAQPLHFVFMAVALIAFRDWFWSDRAQGVRGDQGANRSPRSS